MDLKEIFDELVKERKRVDDAILALERLRRNDCKQSEEDVEPARD